MSETPEKRVRARAVFRSELPLRVVPARVEEDAVLKTARMLAPLSEREEHELACELMAVAKRYQNSVRLRAKMVARPHTGPTLRSLAEQSRSLWRSLTASTTEHHVTAVLAPLTVRSFEAGVDAINAAAEIFEHVSELLDADAPAGDDSPPLGADLSRTATKAATLASMLLNLPMRCEWELVLLQQYEPMMPEPSAMIDGAHLVRELTFNVSRLSLAASQLVSQRRGPSSNTPQMLAVLELKALFERRTRLPATHSAKSGSWYSGCPKSPFGLFAMEAFKLMESDRHRRRGLAEAITSAVWPSRDSARAASIPAQRAERRRAARGALVSASLQTSRPAPDQ